tara:strand:- start:1241 stop:2599 length:1359 start_codon:yes stop_codon:yes gene_type:complete
MTYIFYDTETTGLNSAFDQILQFAAIVTDDDFSIVEEVNLRGRRRPFILPSPGALMVTGITPADFENAPLSHYELVTEIRTLIDHYSPAVLVGFNSIRFDEGMLRQAFYQTLHPTYLTQLNGNSRMDVMRLAHAVAEHNAEAITVPLNDKGRASFKLGDLSQANDIRLLNAHDALADTRATLELARVLRDRAPDVWDMLFAARTKQSAQQTLENNTIVVATDQAFGTKTIVATPFATNPDNDGEVALFDLAHDPTPYLDIDEQEAAKALTRSPRIARIIKANQLPILRPAKATDLLSIGKALALERAKTVKGHKRLSETFAAALANRFEEREPSQHVEELIFEGFPTFADQKLMDQFHRAPWEQRLEIVEQLEDERFTELGTRVIYEERPDLLPEDVVDRFETHTRQRFAAFGETAWTTLRQAERELNSIDAGSSNQRVLKAAISDWLEELA